MLRRLLALAVAAALVATPLRAQDTLRAAVAGGKSPTAARIIGIVPGAGHIYAGEVRRGMAHFGTTIGIFLLSGLMFAGDCIGNDCKDSTTPGLVMLAGFGYWGWSIYDAGLAAERANARRRPVRISLLAAPSGLMLGHGPEARGVRLGVLVAER